MNSFVCGVAVEMKRRIFFENLVQGDRDLVFVSSRFWLDGKCDRGFGIFDRRIDDRLCLVGERVAGLRIFEFYDGDDVAGLRLRSTLSRVLPEMTCRAPRRSAVSRVVFCTVASCEILPLTTFITLMRPANGSAIVRKT